MVINHLLNGMILQVDDIWCFFSSRREHPFWPRRSQDVSGLAILLGDLFGDGEFYMTFSKAIAMTSN